MRDEIELLVVGILGTGALLAASVGTASASSAVTRKLDCSALTLKDAAVDAESLSWEYELAGICQVLDYETEGNTRSSQLVTQGFATVSATWDNTQSEAQEAVEFEGPMEGKVQAILKCNDNPFVSEQNCVLLGLDNDESIQFVANQVAARRRPVAGALVDPKRAWELAGSRAGEPSPPPPLEMPAAGLSSVVHGLAFRDPVVMEGEDIAKQITGQGQAGAQDMRPFGTGWSNDGQLFWNPTGVGSLLNIPLTPVSPGRYRVTIHLTSAPDFAQVRAYVRYGTDEGGSLDTGFVDFDGYAPRVGSPSSVTVEVPKTNGAMTLVLVTMGRNASSSGFFSGIDKIDIKRAP